MWFVFWTCVLILYAERRWQFNILANRYLWWRIRRMGIIRKSSIKILYLQRPLIERIAQLAKRNEWKLNFSLRKAFGERCNRVWVLLLYAFSLGLPIPFAFFFFFNRFLFSLTFRLLPFPCFLQRITVGISGTGIICYAILDGGGNTAEIPVSMWMSGWRRGYGVH